MIKYTKKDLKNLVDSMGDKDTIYAGIFSFDDIKDHSPSRELTHKEQEKVLDHAIKNDEKMQHLFGEVVQEFGFSVAKSLKHFDLDDGWEYQGLTGREKVA
jgi:hypothetical protein